MNDFTQEQLESILNWGDVYCEFGASWTYKIHKPLMDKIQEMIDNYDAKLIKVWQCEKCGHVQ